MAVSVRLSENGWSIMRFRRWSKTARNGLVHVNTVATAAKNSNYL